MSSVMAPDEGDDHDTATEPVYRCARGNEIVARLEHPHPKDPPGGQPDGARQDPGVANQWLPSRPALWTPRLPRSEEHTPEPPSHFKLVCRLLLDRTTTSQPALSAR